jgi:hypothetical protein
MTDKLKIHSDMLKFHAEFHGALKTGLNPHFKSAHFTLEDICSAIAPVLQNVGLFVIHQIDGSSLITSVYNAEGESLRSSMLMTPSNNPQVTASQVSYFRRYNMCCLFNIVMADDDGNKGAMAADLAESKAQAGPVVPKPPATTEQKDALLLYLASDLPDKRQSAYLKKNMDVFTEMDAKGLLDKINAQMEAAK